jgi:predicted RNase H-like HicB family nuclease
MIVPPPDIQVRRNKEGGWTATSVQLPGCKGKGLKQADAVRSFQEAARIHLDNLLKKGKPIPPAFRHRFVIRRGRGR